MSTVSRADATQWWRDAVIYQIYPRSFADANGDGIGDLAGVAQHVDYLADLGVDAVWFSPFYPSPQADTGYDVADYFDINPDYGTLEDARHLFQALKDKGIRSIVDLVPNHTSSDHQWFRDALKAAPNSAERDRYVFRYSEDGAPNNWGAMFGGSAWEPVYPHTHKEEDKNWWYLHLFDVAQPDLNWENPDVHAMFRDFLTFWVDAGVSGFRVDVAHGLVKAEGLPDDTIGPDRFARPLTNEEINSGPMYDQDGVHQIYREWRQLLDEKYGRDIMLVAEAWVSPAERLMRYIRNDEMSQAFNFDFLKAGWHPSQVRAVINSTMAANASVGAPTTWVLSNHDVIRHASRFGFAPDHVPDNGFGPRDPSPDRELGLRRARAASLFMMGLPGSAYMYEGEELGLPEVQEIRDDQRQDPTFARSGGRAVGRDGCRVPLPWTREGTNYGFSVEGGKAPWLPQPKDWGDYSVQAQTGTHSTLEFYRHILALRRRLHLGMGSLEWKDTPESVLAFTNGTTMVAINMGEDAWDLPEGNILLHSQDASSQLLPGDAVWMSRS